ncbi:enoyl-CoA hydratase-related protein [Cupriavidus sp. 30B13]|uniref:enoyl-CoA hydratase-related protein n=1 Tax=Cupriavidus sp. 30B13 TaxID=3384241 RepID=UPI003B916B96
MIPELEAGLAGGILTLTISRTDKKNALTNAMYGALANAIEGAQDDPDIRVVVIQAAGDTFSAGNDVSEFAAQATGNGPAVRHVLRFLRSLATARVPLVAAVQGKAVGVGTTMLLHCDYVLLADDAQLITPFINLALVPEAASSLLMPLRVGHARAFEMFALGEPVAAAQALAWGIANRTVPADQLHAQARAMAARIAAKPAGALLAMKGLMRNGQALVAQMDAESACFEERLKSAEASEAFAAFAQRRPADFSQVARG